MTKEEIRSYFDETCSAELAASVERWLAELKDGSADDVLLRELVDEIKVKENNDQVKHAFINFEKAVLYHENKKRREKSFVRQLGQFYKYVAAVLLMPLLITAVYFYAEKNNPKEWVEEYVPYGQSKMVTLPDSSKLWLNAGTKLIYPKKFNNSIRQVYLAGEAYVEVKKDQKRPFILSAGEVLVEVLGTKFNVKSYSEDSEIVVSLMEGVVRMEANYQGTIKSELLQPGKIVKFSKETGELEKNEFIVANREYWYEGKGFYFIDESLYEIVLALERYFDVRIIIENELLKNEHYYSIFINNESLEEILLALNANGKMRIRRSADIIYIY